MYLIDGDDLYEVDASECEEDESGEGVWVADDDGSDSESFYEYCEIDLDDYDLDA